MDDISLHICAGEIYGFIGHNGAGKTTAIKACCGILDFEAGEIYVDGVSVKKNPLAVAVKINDLSDNMDIRRLPYISDKDVKRLKKYLKAYKKLIGEPVYSVYACRQEYPNAFDVWADEADEQLRQMWAEGTSVADIAQHFGRKQSAIVVRLKKLGV